VRPTVFPWFKSLPSHCNRTHAVPRKQRSVVVTFERTPSDGWSCARQTTTDRCRKICEVVAETTSL